MRLTLCHFVKFEYNLTFRGNLLGYITYHVCLTRTQASYPPLVFSFCMAKINWSQWLRFFCNILFSWL